MKNLSILAAATLLSLGVAAAVTPSFAESIAACENDVTISSPNNGGGAYNSFIASDSAAILAGLRQKGINVEDISDWGGCVKADVVRKDGHVAQEFFDPTSLQRLTING